MGFLFAQNALSSWHGSNRRKDREGIFEVWVQWQTEVHPEVRVHAHANAFEVAHVVHPRIKSGMAFTGLRNGDGGFSYHCNKDRVIEPKW